MSYYNQPETQKYQNPHLFSNSNRNSQNESNTMRQDNDGDSQHLSSSIQIYKDQEDQNYENDPYQKYNRSPYDNINNYEYDNRQSNPYQEKEQDSYDINNRVSYNIQETYQFNKKENDFQRQNSHQQSIASSHNGSNHKQQEQQNKQIAQLVSSNKSYENQLHEKDQQIQDLLRQLKFNVSTRSDSNQTQDQLRIEKLENELREKKNKIKRKKERSQIQKKQIEEMILYMDQYSKLKQEHSVTKECLKEMVSTSREFEKQLIQLREIRHRDQKVILQLETSLNQMNEDKPFDTESTQEQQNDQQKELYRLKFQFHGLREQDQKYIQELESEIAQLKIDEQHKVPGQEQQEIKLLKQKLQQCKTENEEYIMTLEGELSFCKQTMASGPLPNIQKDIQQEQVKKMRIELNEYQKKYQDLKFKQQQNQSNSEFINKQQDQIEELKQQIQQYKIENEKLLKDNYVPSQAGDYQQLDKEKYIIVSNEEYNLLTQSRQTSRQTSPKNSNQKKALDFDQNKSLLDKINQLEGKNDQLMGEINLLKQEKRDSIKKTESIQSLNQVNNSQKDNTYSFNNISSHSSSIMDFIKLDQDKEQEKAITQKQIYKNKTLKLLNKGQSVTSVKNSEDIQPSEYM